MRHVFTLGRVVELCFVCVTCLLCDVFASCVLYGSRVYFCDVL